MNKNLKRTLLVIMSIAIFFTAAYYAKNKMGVDILKHRHLLFFVDRKG